MVGSKRSLSSGRIETRRAAGGLGEEEAEDQLGIAYPPLEGEAEALDEAVEVDFGAEAAAQGRTPRGRPRGPPSERSWTERAILPEMALARGLVLGRETAGIAGGRRPPGGARRPRR